MPCISIQLNASRSGDHFVRDGIGQPARGWAGRVGRTELVSVPIPARHTEFTEQIEISAN
jgi:hypothetical protein